ncbi:MAG: AbrB/MazE/SpoVT family DNA-binding domain-containing protein [Endozoicomonas sp.]
MHKLTAKRQVTLPQSVCNKLGLEPGDYIQVFERDGVAHLMKMSSDDIAGTLSNLTECENALEPSRVKVAVKEKAARKYRSQQ